MAPENYWGMNKNDLFILNFNIENQIWLKLIKNLYILKLFKVMFGSKKIYRKLWGKKNREESRKKEKKWMKIKK